MMTGFLSQWEQEKHYYPKAFDTALSFFMKGEPLLLERKRHAIDGDRIYFMLNDLQTKADPRFELHKEYLDIHLLLQGEERQGWCSLSPSEAPEEDLLDDKDLAFYTAPENAGMLILSPGQYVVYLPMELHAPCGAVRQPEPIVKAIIKIHRSCI